MRVRIEVIGMRDFIRRRDYFDKKIKKTLGPATLKAAKHAQAVARRNVHSKSGELARAITAKITWDHQTSKAFAGVFIPREFNSKMQYSSKAGNQSYIPAAVEYGHMGPNTADYKAFALDKEGNFIINKRGRRKGKFKIAKVKARDKVAKPVKFMSKTYKEIKNGSAVAIIESEVMKVIGREYR